MYALTRLAFRLFLVFTLVPLAELALLVYLGSRIGVWWTVGAIAAVGVAGTLLVRAQGLAAARRVVAAVEAGRMPGDELLEAAVVFAAAVLLITPGFLTDLAGLLALAPPTRALIVRAIKAKLQRRIRAAGGRLDTRERG